MASKYSEYSRLRSIARKRAERLSEAGLTRLVTFPSVKELKAEGIKPDQAIKQVESFLESPTQTRQYKRLGEQQRPVFLQEGRNVLIAEKGKEKEARRKLQNREAARRYREKKYYERIQEENPEFTKKEIALIKGARRLGLNIPVSKAREYVEYMQYRFSYGSSKLKYRISTYVDEFSELKAKKKKQYSKGELMNDFNKYMKDNAELRKKAKKKTGDVNEYGYTGEEVEQLFSDYIKS